MSKKTQITKSTNSTPAQIVAIKEEFVGEIKERIGDKYQETYIEKLHEVNPGEMFYYGSDKNIVIVDNVYVEDEGKGKSKYRNFRVVYRQWDYDEKAWNLESDETSLMDLLESIRLPKLTKHPLALFVEAEEVLKSKDISKYELDSQERGDLTGPDTQLMHLGSKDSLVHMKKDLEARRNHAEIIRMTIGVIIDQKKRELEVIKDNLKTAIKLFEKKIEKIYRVIVTIELYLGIAETIIQIQSGPTASEDEPVCIRQGLMFMDEEVGDPREDDDGEGMEWEDVEEFDVWLTKNNNYKKVLPEKKGIAAFKARRYHKDRRNMHPMLQWQKEIDDNKTFLLMRNGDNLYRIITDKISFRPRLFPKKNELQQLFELWKFSDKKEQEGGDHIFYDDKSELHKKFKGNDIAIGDSYAETKDLAENHVFFYKMRFTLFQGILERTTIFAPTKEPIKLFDKSAIENGLVRLIYDDELTLPSGKKSFWDWLKKLNSKINYGSRIVLSHNWKYRYDFDHDASSSDVHSERLDDRYRSDSKWRNLPPTPAEGLYFVKKGTRFEVEPVWIDNPFWSNKYVTTNDEAEYSPELEPKDKPKDMGQPQKHSGSRQYHIMTNQWISFDDQIKYFGKILQKEPYEYGSKEQLKGSICHDIPKNPKQIQKHELKDRMGWDNKKDKWVKTGSKEAKYITHKVEHNFMCIRYNPKDKIERIGWTWVYDAEERKNSISWKIYNEDAFIINYDEVLLEDIDFYLDSRVDRRDYISIMPLLWKVRQIIAEENKEEVDFKKLVCGEVLKATGETPSDKAVDIAVEVWKKDLKWKRAIKHDDQKALRMIVKYLTKKKYETVLK